MINEKDAVEIIRFARENEVPIWLDGGWGVDALMEKQTRAHNDIDIFVEQINRDKFIGILEEKSFTEVIDAYKSIDHRVWKDDGDRIVDLHLFEFNEQGQPVFEGETYPEDVLSGIGKIGAETVRCISPEYQVMYHLGYEHDEKDVHDVRLLCDRFKIPFPEEYRVKGKIILNLAVSLDGYIADTDGGYDWIVGQGDKTLDTKESYNHDEFLKDIDIVVMGRQCYDQGMHQEYMNKKVYVATSDLKEDEDNVIFCRDIVDRVKRERDKGRNIYLFGGGILIDNFLKADIIDEFIFGIIPTIEGDGRPLFLGDNPSIPLNLKKYYLDDGIMILHYTKREKR